MNLKFHWFEVYWKYEQIWKKILNNCINFGGCLSHEFAIFGKEFDFYVLLWGHINRTSYQNIFTISYNLCLFEMMMHISRPVVVGLCSQSLTAAGVSCSRNQLYAMWIMYKLAPIFRAWLQYYGQIIRFEWLWELVSNICVYFTLISLSKPPCSYLVFNKNEIQMRNYKLWYLN